MNIKILNGVSNDIKITNFRIIDAPLNYYCVEYWLRYVWGNVEEKQWFIIVFFFFILSIIIPSKYFWEIMLLITLLLNSVELCVFKFFWIFKNMEQYFFFFAFYYNLIFVFVSNILTKYVCNFFLEDRQNHQYF